MNEINELIDLLKGLKNKKKSPVEIESKIQELSLMIKDKVQQSEINEGFLEAKISDLEKSISSISSENKKRANTINEFKKFLEKKK